MDDIEKQTLLQIMRRGYEYLPEHMRDSMERYITHGILPGGFMEAVLTNDLKGAVCKADYINRGRLVDIVTFVVNYIPASSQGSAEDVVYWINYVNKQEGERHGA
jgi:hypothetical protein